jgi:hypothetical protein
MNRRNTLAAISASLLFLSLAGSVRDAAAQGAKSLAGSWAPVSSVSTDASGKKSDTFGPNPRGMLVFTSDGRYTLTIMRASLPKFAAKARTKGTAEENQAVVLGSIAHFGKYKVEDKAIVFSVESSTFPNWDGAPQKRPFTVSGDQLRYTVPAASTGGTADLVWKRIK